MTAGRGCSGGRGRGRGSNRELDRDRRKGRGGAVTGAVARTQAGTGAEVKYRTV